MMRRAYNTHCFAQVFLSPRPRQATGALGYVYGHSGEICLRCEGSVGFGKVVRCPRARVFSRK